MDLGKKSEQEEIFKARDLVEPDSSDEEDTKMPARPSNATFSPVHEESNDELDLANAAADQDTRKSGREDQDEKVKHLSMDIVHERMASTDSLLTSREYTSDDEKAHLRERHSPASGNNRPGAWSIGPMDRTESNEKIVAPSMDVNFDARREKEALKLESALQHDDTSHQTDMLESGLISNDPDLVYGEFTGLQYTDQSMAVAFSVPGEDAFIPSALEFDPDSKPLPARLPFWRRPAVTFLLSLVVFALAFIVVSLRHFPSTTGPDALPVRATVGVAESIAQFLQSRGLEPLLENSTATHPYRQALDWIQNVDHMALTPLSSKFFQRYLAAYFYFSTSTRQPWSNGCEPSSWRPFVDVPITANTGSPFNDCTYAYSGVKMQEIVYIVSAKRWLSSDDECLWAGVTCDEGGAIKSLDFSGSNMTGTFPEGIAALPLLQILSLSHGSLTGTLPTVIGNMKHIKRLELAGNRFSGSIPESWYQSRSLQAINIGSSNVAGTLSDKIGNWKDVTMLQTYENELVGSIPNYLGDLRSLVFLDLSSNQLTGSIPNRIEDVKHWFEFFLSRNKLTGSIPIGIGFSKKARYLGLAFNQMNGAIPTELSMLNGLWELDLSHNQFSGGILPLANLTKVEYLIIEHNQFSGELPTQLGAFKDMTRFIASGNNFNGTVPNKICNLIARTNKPGSSKRLEELQMDCAVPSSPGGVAEIVCPDDCCTQCCDSGGMNCQAMIVG